MPFLDAMIYGIRQIIDNSVGTTATQRSQITIYGCAVADDAANSQTLLYPLGGVGTVAMGNVNQTPDSTITGFGTIKTTGAITANRNLTLPAQTDAKARVFVINNTCSGAFSIVVKDSGAGTTVTVGNGKTAWVLMDSRGATRLTADV